MKIPFGSNREKALVAGGFLAAALLSLAALFLYGFHRQPYLGLPLLLGFGALVPFLFPRALLDRSPGGRWVYRAAPALLLMAAVSTASSFSFDTDDPLSVSDSLFHTGEFLALGLLLGRLADPVPRDPRRLLPLLAALACLAAFALFDEWHQGFVPGRQPSLRDIRSDLLGGIGGILAYRLLAPRLFSAGPGAPPT
jgi:VanZ family protein